MVKTVTLYAIMQYYMQRCRISKNSAAYISANSQQIQLKSLGGKESQKGDTAAFHAALQNLSTLYILYFSHFSTEWADILYDYSLGGKDQVYSQNSDPAALQNLLSILNMAKLGCDTSAARLVFSTRCIK